MALGAGIRSTDSVTSRARYVTLYLALLLPYLVGVGLLFGETLSPDSFAYWGLAESIVNGSYIQPSLRDLQLPMLTWYSRSFPPLWPTLVSSLVAAGATIETMPWISIAAGGLLAVLVGRWIQLNATGHRVWLSVLASGGILWSVYLVDEATAGRTIPLSLCLVVVLFGLISRPGWKSTVMAGVVTGVLLLLRTDAMALLLAGAVAYGVGQNSRRSAVLVPLMFLAVAFSVYGPWGARNWMVFGTAFASDNSSTAFSVYPAQFALSYWESAPLFSPKIWLEQRLTYFALNLKLLLTHFPWSPLLLCVPAVLWRYRAQRHTAYWWRQMLFAGFAVLSHLALLSLTPYRDPRYFLVCGLLGFLVVSHRACKVESLSVKTQWAVGCGLMAMLIWTTVQQYGVYLGRDSADSTVARAKSLAADLRVAGVPKGALVASYNAEALEYYREGPTLEFPRNVMDLCSRDFSAWNARFSPDYVVVPVGLLKRGTPSTYDVLTRTSQHVLLRALPAEARPELPPCSR